MSIKVPIVKKIVSTLSFLWYIHIQKHINHFCWDIHYLIIKAYLLYIPKKKEMLFKKTSLLLNNHQSHSHRQL